MQEPQKVQIIIPEGCFESNCEVCIHAYRDKGDSEMYCAMNRKYFYPEEMKDKKCSFYKMRLIDKIKVGIGIYLLVTAVVCFIEVIMG